MSIKKAVSISTVVLAAFLVSSCYRMAIQPTGSISLRLAGPAARAISASAKVRIYLYTYNSSNGYGLYTFGSGKTYQELSYGSGTDSVTGVPTGLWEVLVSVGSDGPGTSFYVSRYGKSGVIDVVGGSNTSASVTTSASPPFTYSTQLAGKDLNGVVWDNAAGAGPTPSLYVSSLSSLFSIPQSGNGAPPSLATGSPAQIQLPAGVQVNTISEGVDFNLATGQVYPGNPLFINSNDGLLPYSSNGSSSQFDTKFSSNLGSGGASYDVGYAVGVQDSAGGIAVYYARSGGFGGVYLTSLSPAPYTSSFGTAATWVDIPSTGSGNPVYSMSSDFYTTDGFTYLATKSGAFRAAPSLVTAGSSSAGNLNSTVPIASPNGAPIVSIAVDDYDGLLYVGTTHGAYYATLNESSTTSAISGSWTPVPSTANDDIVGIKVDISTVNVVAASTASPPPTAPVAFRSPNNVYTFTGPVNQSTSTETIYPFYAWDPGTLHAMDFSHGTLFLAGSNGLASIYVTPTSGG